MNSFQQCHLVMLASLYQYDFVSGDNADPIEMEISSILWNRISVYLQKRKVLQSTTERLKDIQDSLMEAKLLNRPIEEELSSCLAKIEKQQRFHGYGHRRTYSDSVDEDEKKVTASKAIEPFVELEDVVQKELTSLRSEQSSATLEEYDFGFICNKIYLWERLLLDLRQILNIEEDSDIPRRPKPLLTDGIIV